MPKKDNIKMGDLVNKNPYYEKFFKRFFRNFYIGRKRKHNLTDEAYFVYRYIRNMPYVLDENDCSNKNGEFVKRMRECNHDAKIIVIASKAGAHAITWIRGKGFYDATSSRSMTFYEYENDNFDFRDDVINSMMPGYTYRYTTQPDHLMWSKKEFEMTADWIDKLRNAVKKEFGK